jgi:hypothetical protein
MSSAHVGARLFVDYKGYGQDTVKIRTLRNKVRCLSILGADRTRIPRTTYSRPCSSALLIHQDLPAPAGLVVALCTNFAVSRVSENWI